MNLIVCVDDRGGMLFNRRRQSSDRYVTEYILNMAKDSRLFVTPYTAKLFNGEDEVCIFRSWEDVGAQDYCFAEDLDISSAVKLAERLILFRWNRTYPADCHFPMEELAGRKLADRREFPGYSHKCITMEIYTW